MMTNSRTVEIDLGGVATKEEVHDRLAAALGLPEYYGRNWDAFDECIHDLDGAPGRIRVFGVASLEARLPREARLLVQCFRDYQQSEPGRGVIIEIS